MVDVPKWTRLFIHKVAESEGLEVDGKSLDKWSKAWFSRKQIYWVNKIYY